MKNEIIEKLDLKEIPGFWFGMSFVHNVKTYLFGEDIYCALANTDGTPSETGLLLFWLPKVGFTKMTEEFVLDCPKSEIEKILANIKPVDKPVFPSDRIENGSHG